MTEKKYIIGVDLGGTWIRIGLFNEVNSELERVKEPIDVSSNRAVSRQIIRLIHSICSKFDISFNSIKGIGIAAAGPLDTKKGVIVNPTNLPLERVFLVNPIKNALKLPVVLVNDCVAAVLGERMFEKGGDNLFYVSLSTGIGGGAIVDGENY